MESAIKDRVEEFVVDLTKLIREEALEAVQSALEGETPGVRKTRGRKRKARKTRGRPATKKSGKRVRRTAEQVEALSKSILTHIKKNPGQRLGEIAGSLGVESQDARRPAFALVDGRKLVTTGQRGGTRYYLKGAKPKKGK